MDGKVGMMLTVDLGLIGLVPSSGSTRSARCSADPDSVWDDGVCRSMSTGRWGTCSCLGRSPTFGTWRKAFLGWAHLCHGCVCNIYKIFWSHRSETCQLGSLWALGPLSGVVLCLGVHFTYDLYPSLVISWFWTWYWLVYNLEQKSKFRN